MQATSRRRRRSIARIGALAVTLAVVGGAGLFAFAGPLRPPGVSPSAQGGDPNDSPSTPRPSDAVLHYVAPGWLSFDYPPSWSIIQTATEAPNRMILGMVGIGEWSPNCHPLPPTSATFGGFSCGPESWSVPPDGVVVQIYTHFGIGAPTPEPIPSEAVLLPNGSSLLQKGSSERLEMWWLWPPDGGQTYYVQARYGTESVARARSQVEELIDTIDLLWR